VRFVGAPPSSIGKFGADTDNWIWPRHTCDFSMFRVYADKDNNPAEYSEENVPFQPKRHLTVSLKGVEPGDFSMIIGYPGRTNRFMTASELREQRDISNAISIYARGKRQEILMEDMLADPKVKIQYASKYSGSSNGWKKWIGMNETFAKLDVEKRRADEEKAFEKWVSQKSSRQKKYGNTLEKINDAVADRAEASIKYRWLSETIGNVELASAAMMASRLYGKGGLKERMDNFYKNYSPSTDRKVAKEMIKIYRDKIEPASRPDFFNDIDSRFGGDVDAYVDWMFDNSAFASQEKAYRLLGFAEGSETIESDEVKKMLEADPATQFQMSMTKLVPGLQGKLMEKQDQFSEGKKEYIAGQLEMKGKGAAIYPDANSTMRLTYGVIKPYSPRDAVVYNHYTTLKGVMEKEDPNNWEFVVPEKLKELYAAGDFGRYARKDGQMPACFINNGDITGGNSGSPVLNAKGELTGLAFDGNWEAMSGDIIFEPDLQRCICVDIRYVLFIMDRFGGAGYLLDEMTISE
jgi:Peptidase S46.